MATVQPKVFRPEHLHIVRLHWQGYSNAEIAQFLQLSEGHISNILNCDEAKRLLGQLQEHTIDSYADTQDDFQLVMPLIRREKIKLALEATDERVRNMACSDILAIAGHTPVRRLEITRGSDSRKAELEKMTPEQLRDAILDDIGLSLSKDQVSAQVGQPDSLTGDDTDKGPGPGDLLN
jgi:hypothetical protein